MKKLKRLLTSGVTLIVGVGMSGCVSQPQEKSASHEALVATYLSDPTTTSLDILFERGHNSYRFVATHENALPHLEVFHDKQLFKSLKLEEPQFQDLLSKSLEAAASLRRKVSAQDSPPCRTPFVIKVKNNQESFEAEGCRSAEEGSAFGKLVAEIEHLVSKSQMP